LDRGRPRCGQRRRNHFAGLQRHAQDQVTVDGAPLPERERTRLFLYHKPRGLMTTHADPQGRPTIFEHLPENLPRLISVGRLDFNTEGLLLLTNDGALARLLELPATGWLRRYRVRAHGKVNQAQLDQLQSGLTLSGIHYGAIEATIERVQGANLWLTFAIREGKNREVRNVLGHLGLDVTGSSASRSARSSSPSLRRANVEEVRTRILARNSSARGWSRNPASISRCRSCRGRPRRTRTRGAKPRRASHRVIPGARPRRNVRARNFQRKFHGARRKR